MSIAEIKLDLFRKIDNLEGSQLEAVYQRIIALLNAAKSNETRVSPELKVALDDALQASEEGKVYSHEEVMQKTKEKFPNLF